MKSIYDGFCFIVSQYSKQNRCIFRDLGRRKLMNLVLFRQGISDFLFLEDMVHNIEMDTFTKRKNSVQICSPCFDEPIPVEETEHNRREQRYQRLPSV